ncbi:glycosyltransferase [Vibrio tapetis]|uniref:WafY n=1 Tax=Vibrio tapetis subsp. tapetis TaxID=1671868 RepID=A0A2N8ZGJ1_9VIBR|nr:glycosyltransferase [Vibrio tapetis]SON51006.1 WafY [Vibrio tapetis subsp. tapetis]
MKKVIYYVDSMAPSGGIERVISTLLFKLHGRIEIVLLTKDFEKSFYPIPADVKCLSLRIKQGKYESVKAIRIRNIAISLFDEIKKLSDFLKSTEYDLFYCTHPISVLAYRLAGGDSERLIISEHGSHGAYNIVYRTIKKFLYLKCKSYIVPTLSDTDYYNSIGIPAKYIPHFRPNLDYSQKDRRLKQVLNVGRLTDDKQQGLLIDIWNDVLNENPNLSDWSLIILGSGENSGFLRKKIATSKFASTILIVDATPDIVKYYKRSSIFALTSRFEGFGMVLIEAMSFGLPVISFDCPSGPRDIINIRNGYLVPCFNKQLYSNHLQDLMVNDALREEISQRAFNEGKKWDSELITNKWLEVLK